MDSMAGEVEVEYLSEWPPPSERDSDATGSLESRPTCDGSMVPVTSQAKRAKLELLNSHVVHATKKVRHESTLKINGVVPSDQKEVEELTSKQLDYQGLNSDEMHIVHSHYSVKADVLLARWWKANGLKLDITAGLAGDLREERILSLIKSNTGPQSQLYHISRYAPPHYYGLSVIQYWWGILQCKGLSFYFSLLLVVHSSC